MNLKLFEGDYMSKTYMDSSKKFKLINVIANNDLDSLKAINLTKKDLHSVIFDNKTFLETTYTAAKLTLFKYILRQLKTEPKYKAQEIINNIDLTKNKKSDFAFFYELSKNGYLTSLYGNAPTIKQPTIDKAIYTCLLKDDKTTLNFIRNKYFLNKTKDFNTILRDYKNFRTIDLKTELQNNCPELFTDKSQSEINISPSNFAKIQNKDTTYKSVQCVGFSLGTDAPNEKYTALEDDKNDWHKRVGVIVEAIDNSYKSTSINRDPNCLKIFMAPEFFFRGSKGAYDMDTTAELTASLRDIVKSPKYKDWLFVFGTTVAYSKGSDRSPKDFTAYNFSFIQKGNGGEKESQIVMKENKSWIDFVTSYNNSNILTIDNTKYLAPVEPLEKRNEVKEFNFDSNAVFEMDGLRFAVEICLDNIETRVDSSRQIPNKPIDVHLVPSCGVGYARASSKLSQNGVLFMVDGSDEGKTKVADGRGNNQKVLEKLSFSSSNEDVFYKLFNSEGVLSVYTPLTLEKNKSKGFDVQMQ